MAEKLTGTSIYANPRGGMRSLFTARELPALTFLALLTGAMFFFAPNFGSRDNLFAIGQDVAITGIMAVGMTMVILTAGIDLSVASVLALSAAVTGTLMMGGLNMWASVLAGLAVGAACGYANGVLIAWLRVPPIITTLGMMGILRASVYLYTGGNYIGPLPMDFAFVGVRWTPVIILGAVALGFTLFLSRVRLGRHIHAIGSNEEAVRLSGIRVNRVKLAIYTMNGLLAAVSGMIMASSWSSVQSNMAKGYELGVIAAVVIGGTSINGGLGSVPGTIIGAGIMSLLYNALNLLGISKFWHQFIIGIVILAAVLMDRFRSKK